MAESDGASSPAAAIELEVLTFAEEPAASRFNRSAPSVRLGRELSLRTRRARGRDGAATDGPFERRGPTYSSLPHQKRRAEGASEPGRLRRASSFQCVGGGGDSEGWQELAVTFSSLRQSSRRLEDRIAVHRHSLRNKPQYTRRNVWGHFKHVRWPKLKSRLRVVLGYELWKGHLKEVEGNFGTGVVSYFIFLRWLFLMNLLIFLLWFGLVVIPQLIWVGHTGAPRTPSQLSCVFNFSLVRECPDGPPPNNLAAAGRRLVCARSVTPSQFKVGLCQFEKENGSLIARTEHPSRTVSVSECNATSTDVIQHYYLCPVGIDPVTPWYQYIFEFVLGKGLFNDTVLFYGRYTNETVQTVGRARYSVPLAYLMVTGIVFAISVILLVYKMGQAYNESYLAFTSKQTLNYCNKVFSSWDFTITDQTTARLKKAQIRREFEEDIADLEKRSQSRDVKEWVLVFLSRLLANVFVFVILAAAGAAIYYAAVLGLENQLSGDTSSLQLQGLLLPMVITAFNTSLPILFSFLARFERFKTQSGEIRMTLIRAIIVRLSSLIVLVLTLFILISCTQSFNGGKAVEEEEEEDGVCQFSVPDVETLVFDENSTETFNRENCPQCWETFVGQEFYKLGLINFVLTSLTTLVTESSRNLLSRLLSYTKFVFLREKVGKGEFNIAKSILDLTYTQSLLWLGFFYSPFLPFVVLITSFVLFYVKKYSLIWNLVPSKRGAFKASRTNFLFLFLMLAVLLTSLLPIGYGIARLHPSQACGPFRGKEIIYDVITNVLEQAGCRAQQYLDYFQSTGFLVPVIMVLLLLCYAQWVVLRARKKKFNLLKQQLILESADATFYGQQLKRRERAQGGVESHDLQDGPVVGMPSLEQRLEARQSLTEESTIKRTSGQVPKPLAEWSEL